VKPVTKRISYTLSGLPVEYSTSATRLVRSMPTGTQRAVLDRVEALGSRNHFGASQQMKIRVSARVRASRATVTITVDFVSGGRGWPRHEPHVHVMEFEKDWYQVIAAEHPI
jgi:hypothetical protein